MGYKDGTHVASLNMDASSILDLLAPGCGSDFAFVIPGGCKFACQARCWVWLQKLLGLMCGQRPAR